jgi:RNA polymerase sigma-70 factor (ECF subfamily)
VSHGETAGLAAVTDAMLASAISSAAPGAAHEEEAELYRRFAPRVRLYGLKHLRDAAAADDLVQQVFVVTIERLRGGGVRSPDAIASFILGTSRTIAGGLRRTHDRRERLADTFADRTASTTPMEETVNTGRLESCLNSLSPRDRLLLVLTFYAERNAADVASELHMAPGAVRVARHRALMRLRECVVGRPGGHEDVRTTPSRSV